MVDRSRTSGVLAHISSLPGKFGIGNIGQASYRFIDFLVAANQTCWQFLPTGPTAEIFDHSPYMTISAFAGSPFLLCPELLYSDGLLSATDLHSLPECSEYITEFKKISAIQKKLLQQAFLNFDSSTFDDFEDFVEGSNWLEDYSLFRTAKEVFHDAAWYCWPIDFAQKKSSAIRVFSKNYIERIAYYNFEQFVFHRQWQALKRYAADKGVLLFGDLPIYVGHDSVDVWGNQEIFCLDLETRKPTLVAGVPPDYFSESGQRWGNPIYDWNSQESSIQDKLFNWWKARLSHIFWQVDIARIDHFRGFESYWAIPSGNETAIHGEWLKGPGSTFFNRIFQDLGQLNIVAEDLGIITREVEKLRDTLGFPGMKVLQFAFDDDPTNSFLPHNFESTNFIVYTGTHDNNTSLGWYLSDLKDDASRATVKQYANRDSGDQHGIHNDLIYLAMGSIAKTAIIPLQDLLGFGQDCRMNTPGTATGNWRWRCAERFLNEKLAEKTAGITRRFNRGRIESTHGGVAHTGSGAS